MTNSSKKIFPLLLSFVFIAIFLSVATAHAGVPRPIYTLTSTGAKYYDTFIIGVDLPSFDIFSTYSSYSKDKNTVYYEDKSIVGSDPKSFVDLGRPFSKDKNHVYYEEKIIPEAIPATFIPLRDFYAADGFHVFYKSDSIAESDVSSFKFVKTTDGSEGSHYAYDKNHLYYNGILIPGATPDNVRLLETGDYAANKTQVFHEEKIIEGADPKSFQFILAPSRGYISMNPFYTKDAVSVFYNDIKIPDADASTFMPLNADIEYAVDKNFGYFQGTSLGRVDVETFQTNTSPYLGEGYLYAWDKDNLYFEGIPVPGVDTYSLHFFPDVSSEVGRSIYFRDWTSVYHNGKKLIDADRASFNVDYYGKVADKYSAFKDGVRVTTATFPIQEITPRKEFSDISESSYRDSINTLQGRKIISGYADGTFKATQLINRAEFLKIVLGSRWISTAIQSCKVEQASPTSYVYFTDVPKDTWFTPYVCLAKNQQIIQGYPDGTFKPEQTITVAEALKILYVTFKEFPYQEASVSGWYVEYMNEATTSGVLMSEFSKLPHHMLMRGEMAEIMVHFLKIKNLLKN